MVTTGAANRWPEGKSFCHFQQIFTACVPGFGIHLSTSPPSLPNNSMQATASIPASAIAFSIFIF